MTISGVSGMAEIKAENAKLKAENVRLKEWYQTALMLQAENQSLKKLLNFKAENTQTFTTSRVISDAGNAFVKTVLVASGSKEGVEKNQAVLAGEGMVGRVSEVGKKASRVLLVTDINSRIPILIEDTNQKAILAGNNSNFPTLKHLPQDSGGIEGKRVITSGHGGIFQPGLPIGRVIKNSSGELAVNLYADIDRVTLVRILKGNSDTNYMSAESLETSP
jgi:rod shape-determining protein MreC